MEHPNLGGGCCEPVYIDRCHKSPKGGDTIGLLTKVSLQLLNAGTCASWNGWRHPFQLVLFFYRSIRFFQNIYIKFYPKGRIVMYKRIRYGGIKGKPSNYSEFIIDSEEDLSLIPIENDECSIGSLAYGDKKVFILYPSGWFEFNNDVKNIANKYYENVLTKYVLRDFDEELIIDSETIGHYAGAPIKSVIATNALNMIDYAFYMCTNLTDINMPNVTIISDGAFSYCDILKNINSPNATSIGGAAFYNCTNLTDINLPSVTSIGNNAFYNCTNLKDIYIPNVISIGSATFYNCKSLTDISLPNATSIGVSAFYGCIGLTSITDDNLPKVTSLPSNVFRYCNLLETVSLSNVAALEGSYVFADCTSLRVVNLPNLAEINLDIAFSNCTSLTDLTLPNLTKIYKNTFTGCSLTNLRLPKITSFDSNAIGWDLDCVIENLYLDGIITLPAKSITNVKNVYLENCTTIKTNGFYSENRLIYVYIPKVTKLEKNAFYKCANIESINLPSATSLGTTVFNSCTKLKHINASAIKSIAATSLKSIPSLESIYLKSCTTIAANSFSGNTGLLDIYLPNATYSNAPWGAVNATIHYSCEFNEDGIPLELLEEEEQEEGD